MTAISQAASMPGVFSNRYGKVLRTPDTAFNNLPDYPFDAHYVEIDGMRMHYVDEGQGNHKIVFLLHGQPSWSYLYRHMIPVLVDAGYRVISPDLIGFGKSDKPVSSEAHTYANHVDWMQQFVQQLDIRQAAAFMQDWGGMIGLRVLAREPQWLQRLAVANTALAEMKGLEKFMVPKVLKLMAASAGKPGIDKLTSKLNYGNWAGYFRHAAELETGKVLQALTTRQLSPAEMKAYDAPFPTPEFYAGPRKMPEIVATELDAVNADWVKLKQWRLPVLALFSDQDPFLAGRGYDKKFQQNFPGAEGQPHKVISNASHFLQEDQSPQLLDQTINWLRQTGF
ncbi:haloalkane dehalogenase [Amphritea balenae]|uniref:Alpha/beta fold hydrolase n=1 Tax=Amphritea balenae TaxID=452629 RepID=A0A3P1SVI8_9GAMM|nr:haloalkane dehalogenase [Amphritea balenae]RRD01234.1 alpha/beta fold hydrolase [Amphritea balenae]GGK58803.1 haloalkane dehalogenase 1 [Amphritea balenae]